MTIRSTILIGVTLMAAVAAALVVWPSVTRPDTPAAPAAASTTVADPPPPPAGIPGSSSAPSTPLPSTPPGSTGLGSPQAPSAEVAEVTEFVAAFAVAFARPDPAHQQQWNRTVPAFLDEPTRDAVATLTAAMVPYRHVTGTPTVTTGQFPHRATVPTDAGTMTLTVCRDRTGETDTTGRLLICGIEMDRDQ